jgi:hypothetical protein
MYVRPLVTQGGTMNSRSLVALAVLAACAPASREAASTLPVAHGGANGAAAQRTISFASDPSWTVSAVAPDRDSDQDELVVGMAERVCLNSFAPSPCPQDAVQYGFAGSGWGADLSSIPGASWIWAPNVTGDTFPADLAQFYFSKKFHLHGRPLSGTVIVAADDFAEVLVNGHPAGTNGSITDVVAAAAAQNGVVAIDVTAFLKPGRNIITVHGQNGPPSYAASAVPTSYRQNPAAVVFGGTLTYRTGGDEDDCGDHQED